MSCDAKSRLASTSSNDGEFWTVHGDERALRGAFLGPYHPSVATVRSRIPATSIPASATTSPASAPQWTTRRRVLRGRRAPSRAQSLEVQGPEPIKREIDVFNAAIEPSSVKVEEAFLAVLAPGWYDQPLRISRLILCETVHKGGCGAMRAAAPPLSTALS